MFTLRNWKRGDEQGLQEMLDNPNIIKNLSDSYHYPFTEDDARRYVREYLDPSSTNFAVTLDERIIGGTELIFKEDPSLALVEGWIGEPYWKRGIGHQMFRVVTQFAFDNYSIDTVEARVFTWNTASARTLEKAGFTFEDILKNGSVKHHNQVDVWIYHAKRDYNHEKNLFRIYKNKFGQ